MKVRVTIDAQSFEVEVGDLNARPVPATVDGDTFLVWLEEQDSPVPAAPRPSATRRLPESSPLPARPATPANGGEAVGARAVTAPIPGVIISVSVKEGDSVTFGQELCILEAMKMKNLIRATRAGKIAAIRVAAGDQVKHSQVLMEYTD